VELVIDWLKALAATKIFGSREPNILGSDVLTEDHFLALKAILRGATVEAIQQEPPPQLQTGRIDEIISDLKTVPLLTAMVDASEVV
jgi:hypothetical protein